MGKVHAWFHLFLGPNPKLRQSVPPCLLLRTASLSTRKIWPNGFDSCQNRNERSAIKSKKSKQPIRSKLGPTPSASRLGLPAARKKSHSQPGQASIWTRSRAQKTYARAKEGASSSNQSKSKRRRIEPYRTYWSSGREGRGEPVCGLQRALATSAPRVCEKNMRAVWSITSLFFS